MKILTIGASYNGKVNLSKEVFDYLGSGKNNKKKYTNIVLFASVQFVKHLPTVKAQLNEKGYNVITTKASRTHVEGQILGCDVYEGNISLNKELNKKINKHNGDTGTDIDCFLYIGDGLFHPKALLFAQKERSKEEFKEVLMYDPIGDTFRIFNYKDNEKVMKRLKGNLMKLLASENLGFIATIKPGQSFLNLHKNLQDRYPKKKVYVFLTDNISEQALEGFPFVDVWINSACPRLGFDDAEHMEKSMVNIVDALNAEDLVGRLRF